MEQYWKQGSKLLSLSLPSTKKKVLGHKEKIITNKKRCIYAQYFPSYSVHAPVCITVYKGKLENVFSRKSWYKSNFKVFVYTNFSQLFHSLAGKVLYVFIISTLCCYVIFYKIYYFKNILTNVISKKNNCS